MIQLPFPNSPAIRALRQIGHWLIEPSPRLQSPEQRRQAQLLSVIQLILIVFGFTAGILAYWEELKASPYDQVVTGASMALILIAYRLGRTHRYMISAVFTIAMVTAAVFAAAIPDGDTSRANVLIYLVLPVLLSSVLLPFRHTARLIALQTAGMLAYELYFHIPDAYNWMGFVLSVSIMILISARYLVQRERIRQSVLSMTESRYQAFVENLPIGVYRTTPSPAGEFIMANPTFVSIMGFESEADLKTIHVVDIYIDPEDRTRFIASALAQGSVGDVELRLKRKDGTPLWGLVSARIVQDDNDGTVYCDCTVKDITTQKQAEAALKAGEQRYRALFDHSLNAFALHTVVMDEQGKVVDYVFLEANRAFEDMIGLRAADIIGRPVTEVIPGIEDTSLIHIYGHVAQTREPVRFEQFFPPLGRHYDIAAFSPQPGQFAALFFDITARVEAENALRESEAQYRELFEGVDDVITVHDLEGRILDINEAACRRLGFTREELLQMKVTDLDEPGEYADGFAERLRQQIADGQLGGINGVHVTKDGRRIDIEVNSKVINYHGQRAVLAVVRDITERKRAEHQLRENEARYRAVVERQSEFIVRWTPDGTRTFVNEAYCRYFGQPREQLIGQKFVLTTEDTIRSIIDHLTQSRDGKPIESDTYRLIKPDGTTGWIEWFDHGVFNENGQLVEIQSVGRDVTERILMGEQVRQERDRAQQYLDIAGVMLVALNTQGEIILINRKGREILGYAEDELIGQKWFERCLPPRSGGEVFSYFREVVSGNVVAFEHYENPIITKTGEERLIAWHNTLLHDAAGGIVGTLSSGEDITERRQNEEALRAQRTLAEALRDITALINSTLDPTRVFDRILTNLGRVVPHDFADIMMIEGGVAHVVSFHSRVDNDIDEEGIHKLALPLSEATNLRHMVESGQPCSIPDTHHYPDWIEIPETRWIHSYIGAPINVSGETIGFINVNSTQPYFFTQDHVERLQAFADQAATAINNARSYDDLERRIIDRTIDLSVRNAVAETLSNTLEIGPMLDGVLRTTVERLGVMGGAIHLIADDDSAATLNLAAHYGIPFDMISPITGIASGDTFLNAIKRMPNHTAPPPETGIFARLSVPIWRQGQIHGVITLVHDQPRPWRGEETRMLDAIGRQIGVALVNARLYAEAVRDEAHIRTILQSVAEGLLVFDQDDNLMLMNPAAEALFSFYPSASGGAECAAARLWEWLHIHPDLPDEPVEFSLPTVPITQFEPDQADEICHLADHAALVERDPHWPCWLLPDVAPSANARLCPIYERVPRRVLQANSAIVRDADGETLGTVIALHDVTYFHELDELKGRFVSTVSHELRTPLSVVLLQVSTLIKYYDRLADAQRREMVSEIQQQAHVLRELIEDILELSRFDAHRSMPQKQWFDLSSHCDELLLSLEPTLREKHLALTVQQRLASSYIRADPQQVMRVLRNLLSNAIKYTADGGHIALEMAPAGDNIRLTVTDTGIGIAPEEQLYVFDRFYRAERASRMASGTGLGLAITKEIVDLHGGRIEVDSTPGEGSTFTIYLPVYEE